MARLLYSGEGEGQGAACALAVCTLAVEMRVATRRSLWKPFACGRETRVCRAPHPPVTGRNRLGAPMPVVIQCVSCQKKVGVPESAIGKKVKCPACGAI